jgi:RNA polymerase sigma factor (sigma-70 family)
MQQPSARRLRVSVVTMNARSNVRRRFLAAADRWATFGKLDEDRRRAWLFRVARNKAIDVFRHNDVAQKYLDREAQLIVGGAYGQFGDDVFEHAISLLTLQRFWKAIGALPPSLQLISFLRFRVGMSCEEIANHLDRRVGTITSQISIAAKRLTNAILADPMCGADDPEGGQGHE